MNHPFKNIDPKVQKALKLASIALGAIIVLAIVSSLFGGHLTPALRDGAYPTMAVRGGGGVSYDMAVAPSYAENAYGSGASLSARNIAPYPPTDGYSMGNDAEWYEVTQYSATIESGDAKGTCAEVSALKGKTYVIFENSSSYDKGCSHVFKVEHAHVAEVLAALEALDPRDLSENVRTIKQTIDDYTSEEEILQGKLAAIDETLQSALKAYDAVTVVATRAGDAGALAKIIDSKLGAIERLTQERINIGAQLERLARAKDMEFDRLEYTYFHVSVYENSVIDGTTFKDSWKAAAQDFVRTVNRILQDVTIGVVALALLIVQYAIYALILVFVAKHGWRLVKAIWNK